MPTKSNFPPKRPCPECLVSCDDGHNLQCYYCQNYYHTSCTKLSKRKLLTYKSTGKKFMCKYCSISSVCYFCEKDLTTDNKLRNQCIKCKTTFCKSCTQSQGVGNSQSLLSKPFICVNCNNFEKCKICLNSCIDWPGYEPSIQCSYCKHHMHFHCCKLKPRQFRKKGRSNDTFYCPICVKDNIPFSNVPNTKFPEVFRSENTNNAPETPMQELPQICELCINCNPECEQCNTCPDL